MAFFDKLADIFSNQSTRPVPPETFLASSLGVPSVSVAVLDKGTIEARCFSTLGDDEHTRFQAASISKPTAAAAVMRLVAQRKLSLDDKVMRHLPEELLALLGPRALLDQITLRHLLTHTAGFRTAAYSGYDGQEYPSALDTLMDRNGGHNVPERLAGFPGQVHAYCGGGFAMLQIILEKICGRPFAEIVGELVLQPLGMEDSTYDAPSYRDDNKGRYARSWWTGTQPHDAPWHHHPELASGGLWTTPTDLLKLIRGIQRSLKDDTPETERFVPQHVAREMLTQVRTGVAVSWFVSRRKGNVFGHFGGNSPCFRCYVVGFADPTGGEVDARDVAEGCGVAVMTNGLEGTDVCCKVVHAVAHVKGWPYVGTLEQLQEISVPVKDVRKDVDGRWEGWVGEWEGGWTIKKSEEGGPRARFGGFEGVGLVPVAMPAERGEDGEPSIDLLVDGLQVMLRLHVVGGRRAVDVWSGLTLRTERFARKGE